MPKVRRRFGPLKTITKDNLNKLSNNPGVYGVFTKSGKLQKVGRAKRYRPDERILESRNEIREAKGQAEKFGFIPTKTVEEAKKLETKLIKLRKPPFNKEQKGK